MPLLVVILFHLFLLFNLEFTAWPEMISYPYLVNSGFKLYTDFIHPYPPLLTLLLGFTYKIFGVHIWTLKIFTWIIVILSDITLFLIAKKFISGKIPYLVLFVYVIFQTFLDGNMLWFDNALVLPLLLTLYFTISEKYFFGGFFLTIAFLVKQTSFIYLLPLALFAKKKLFRLLIIPVIGLTILNIDQFWQWGFVNPFLYWTNFPGYVTFDLSTTEKVIIASLVILLFPSLFLVKKRIHWLLGAFIITAIFATYPRFSFFHLQPLFGPLALMIGFIYQKYGRPYLTVVFLVILLIFSLVLPFNWHKPPRFWESRDVQISKYLTANSSKSQSVFLIGLNSSLYALSGRLPPTPWSDNFGWYFAAPGVENKVLEGLSQNNPELILVQTPQPGNWYDLGTYRPPQIMNFIHSNYYLASYPFLGIEQWLKKP